MGTSSSHGGQKDRPPLLPHWALPAPVPPVPQPELTPAPPVQNPSDTVQPTHPAAPALQPTQTPTYGPLTGKPLWTKAARSLGRVAESGGSRGVGRAAQRYVRARGGSKRASAKSPAGRQATAGVAGFLSDVARNGFADAFANLGLGTLVGRDLDSVIAAVTDALCPAGADREEVAAREASTEALEEVFADTIKAGGDMSQLDAMTAAGVGMAIEAMVASYIYNRWLVDLGVKIEEKAISPHQAVLVEKRMKEFIRDAVKLDLQQKDPLKVDWRGTEGKNFMGQIYSDAYAVIGGER
jgi:hypothetical protein